MYSGFKEGSSIFKHVPDGVKLPCVASNAVAPPGDLVSIFYLRVSELRRFLPTFVTCLVFEEYINTFHQIKLLI